MLLFDDRLEKQHSSRDVNIDKVCLPVRRADLGPLNFKRSAFGKPTKNPETKIDIFHQMPVDVGQPFLLWVDRIVPAMLCRALDSMVDGTNAGSELKLSRRSGALPAVV